MGVKRQAFAVELIDDGKDFEPRSAQADIVDKVQTPDLVWGFGFEHRSGPGALLSNDAGNKSGLTENRLGRFTALAMVKRRAEDAGHPDANRMTNHSFRASGITAFLSQGGQLEESQKIAGHATPKTTKLYDYTTRQVLRAHIERIRY